MRTTILAILEGTSRRFASFPLSSRHRAYTTTASNKFPDSESHRLSLALGACSVAGMAFGYVAATLAEVSIG